MKLFILKTDIKTKKQVNKLKSILENLSNIRRWAIDIDDRDRVLKLETLTDAEETEMIRLIRKQGFYCDSLPE
ncbi:MAG: hypothetical protein AAF391_05930 [Bacteroidota bacterium]